MLRNFLIVCGGLLFLYGMFTVGAPFLMALLVAIFLEPLNVRLIQYTKINRIFVATVTCSLFVVLFFLFTYLVLAKIVTELISLIKSLDYAVIKQLVNDLLAQLEGVLHRLPPEVATNVQHYALNQVQSLQTIAARLSAYFVSWLSALPGLLLTFLVFMIAVYLFSYSLDSIKQTFLHFFEERSRAKVDTVLGKLRKAVTGFLRAQAFLSSLTFLMAFIGLLLLDVKYAVALAFLIIVVDVLPVLGTGSVLVPWAGVAYFGGDTTFAIGLIVLFIVITVVRRAVEPKVLGEQLGIATLPTLMSLYVGFQLVGAIGLLLGPIVVIIYQAMVKVGLLSIRIRLES